MRYWKISIAAVVIVFVTMRIGGAHEESHQADATVPTGAIAQVALFDNPLLDSAGESVRLTEAVNRRPAAIIGFFYSHCDVACPITTTLLQSAMARLPDYEQARVQVVLITLDPVEDTTTVLADYAKALRVPPDWLVLTGRPSDVNHVLVGLGAYASELVEHPPQLLVRADALLSFERQFGLPDKDAIAAALKNR